MTGVQKRIAAALEGRYDAAALECVKKALCTELLGMSQLQYYTGEPFCPDPERERMFDAALERLAAGEPLQHVLGTAQFMGLELKVDRRVLVPRPETAGLVEWVLSDCGQTGTLLDIGTGSGCIAISLSHLLPSWSVQAWDISPDALQVARENNLKCGTKVEFRQRDILSAVCSDSRFDVIVSNPPYVTQSEKALMEPVVLDYEPHLALFVPDDDALRFYRAISDFAMKALNSGGRLYFEINPLFAHELKDMLERKGYRNVTLRSDDFGKLRYIKADTDDRKGRTDKG